MSDEELTAEQKEQLDNVRAYRDIVNAIDPDIDQQCGACCAIEEELAGNLNDIDSERLSIALDPEAHRVVGTCQLPSIMLELLKGKFTNRYDIDIIDE